jgi:hypothetical protein
MTEYIQNNNNNNEFENQILNLENKIQILNKQKKLLSYKINEIESEEKKFIQEIKNIKEIKDKPLMKKIVKEIDVENILSDDEINKIYQGMDKSDYSDCGVKDWLDVEKLVNQAIKIKNKYRSMNFILDNVKISLSEDRYPPNNYYNLRFIDSEGLCFTKSC